MRVIRGDCADVLPETVKEDDCVILDPPRSGCDERVLRAAARAEKIIYISCNPPTLARDVKILTDSGFGIKTLRPYDMFPASCHVETLICLERK